MPKISANRLKSLLAAEEFCRAARLEYTVSGIVGKQSWPWFDQWFRYSGITRYDKPKPTHPTYCCSCGKWHIAGEHTTTVS